ncbi:MAG: RND transporter [Deltaproteobacteria bacterium]|nr:RND transporter [Deltaproteobacteria bacterium]
MLQSIPYSVLLPLAVLMALAPFHPKPHLVEKVQMLLQGELRRPLDIFDLVLHATPLALVVVKWLTS